MNYGNKDAGGKSNRTENCSINNRIPILKALRNTAFLYLIISFLTGKMSVFASLCAGLPFSLPVVLKNAGKPSGRIAKSTAFGIPGILLSVIFMLATGTYNTKTWLLPALLGFCVCCAYSFAESRLSDKALVTAKSIILTGMFLVCFL